MSHEENDIKETIVHQYEETKKHVEPSLKRMLDLVPPLHPAGWPFVAVFAIVTAILALVSSVLGWIGVFLTAWCLYFFRNPKRVTPLKDGLVVAPADGLVVKVEDAPYPAELEKVEKAKSGSRISIFLNVFDVHVNRIPIEGKVEEVVYRPGKFVNASLDKASVDNERSTTLIRLSDDRFVAVTQIAGLVARRIINEAKKGKKFKTGEVFGLIRFGSRVDVTLPAGVTPQVIKGQRMIAGETVLADLNAKNDKPLLGKAH